MKEENQQLRGPISNWLAGLDVLVKQDVLWAESPHKVHQEVTGASVIEILLLPEMRNELSKHKI